MDGLQSFQYSTLPAPAGQIRLLRVLGDESAEFDCCCEMHAFNIERAPEYEAISYTWGSIESTKIIGVNGAAFEARENCWLALCQRRSLNSHLKWIWIDSICINQGDDDEKSEQVQMMADIYRRAACVLLSFPDTDGRADHLVSSIAKAQTLAPRGVGESPRRYQYQDFHDVYLWDEWISYLEGDYRGGLGQAKELKAFVDAILDFASQPYWTRVWVVQELWLAKQKKIMYGKYFIDWEPFMSLFRMADDMSHVRHGFRSYKTLQRLDKAQLARLDDWIGLSMTNMLYYRATERRLYSLKFDLPKISKFQCYDTRDRIYGLLRMIDWSPALGIPKVDYRKSRLQLAIELVELHRSVSIGSSFTLESDILRALELQTDYNSKEVQTSLEVRWSRDSFRKNSLSGECACPGALLPRISSAASRLTQGTITSADTNGLCLNTWQGHQLLLRLTDDESAYIGHEFNPNASSKIRPNVSEATAFFSPNLQAGDKVICPFDSDIPYMQRGNLVLRSTTAGCSEVVGVGVYKWPEDRVYVPSYDTFTLDLLFDAEDILLLIIVLLGGAHLDDWGEEDLHKAYKRLSRFRCRSRFSSLAALVDVAHWTESQWDVPPICAECGSKLIGKTRQRHCKRYGMPV